MDAKENRYMQSRMADDQVVFYEIWKYAGMC